MCVLCSLYSSSSDSLLFILFLYFFFFFNDTATTEIYTLSLHDALPILKVFLAMNSEMMTLVAPMKFVAGLLAAPGVAHARKDRKSTRLNSSHVEISYAVFCLKKKKKKTKKNKK